MGNANRKVISRLVSQIRSAEAKVKNAETPTEKCRVKDKITVLRRSLAWKYLETGAFAEAEAIYHKLSKADHHYYYGMSRLYMDQKQYEQAAWYIEEGLKRFPDSSLLLNTKGILLRTTGEPYRALECFDQAILMLPDEEAPMLQNKAGALHEIRYYHEARQLWVRLSEMQPEDGMYCYSIAACDMHLEDYPSSIKWCRAAIDRGYEHVLVFEVYCQSLLCLDFYHECAAVAQSALEQFPQQSSMLYWFAGYTLGKTGQHELAIEMFDKALAISPNDEFFASTKASFLEMKADAEETEKRTSRRITQGGSQ